jgi:hypothetical protein
LFFDYFREVRESSIATRLLRKRLFTQHDSAIRLSN